MVASDLEQEAPPTRLHLGWNDEVLDNSHVLAVLTNAGEVRTTRPALTP